MNNTYKMLGWLLAIVLIGSGCAGDVDCVSETDEEEAEVYTEDFPLEGELDITFFYEEVQHKKMIQEFMKENPGVTVREHTIFEEYPSTAEDYREGLNRLATEIMSGTTADIYETSYISGSKYWENGYFEDYYSYINQDPSFDREEYYMNILEACETDGRLYQFPEGFYYTMIRLNRKILERLDYEVPETMDYEDIYELFLSAKEKGLVDDDFILDEHSYLYNYIRLAEQRIYIRPDEKQVDLESEEFIKCLRALWEMAPYRVSYSSSGFTDIKNLDENCLLSMFPSFLDVNSKDLYQETETATAPILFTSSDGKLPFVRIGSYWSICSGSDEKALAWEFVKYCVQHREMNFDDAFSDAYFQNYFTYGSMINKENSRQIAQYYLGDDKATIQKYEEDCIKVNAQGFEDMVISSFMEDTFAACMNGEVSPEECAEQMQQRIYAYVNE